MSIHKIGSDLIRPSGPKGLRGGPGSAKHSDTEEVRRVDRTDRIDISDEGRELAAQLASRPEGLSESRSKEVSERIVQGFYDKPTIAARLAERLLSSGELGIEP